MTRRSDVIESLAIVGAAACIVHCLALPLLVALLPTLGAIIPLPATVHLAILAFAVPTTAAALYMGYRAHGMSGPLLAGVAGLILLAIGVLRYGETRLEVPITLLGSLAIAGAHVVNWRHRATCA